MKNKLITGEVYHIVNRAVENRIIFQNKRDYERFLLTMIECNSLDLVDRNRYRRIQKARNNSYLFKNNPLVEILVFSLMPNHFHIAVKQLVDGGIAKFMQKLCGSYAKYFNIKNHRKGTLFMSRYKSVHVYSDRQIRHLITYIHANPLDIVALKWREGKIKNFKKAKEFLKNYKWSSYPLYSDGKGENLIAQIISRKFTSIFYPRKNDHLVAIRNWSNRYFEEHFE